MWTCSKCETVNEDEHESCVICAAQKDQLSTYCQECGSEMLESARFCKTCGAETAPRGYETQVPIPPNPTPSNPIPSKPMAPYDYEKKNRKKFIAAIAVTIAVSVTAVVGFAFALGFIAFDTMTANTNNPTDAKQTNSAAGNDSDYGEVPANSSGAPDDYESDYGVVPDEEGFIFWDSNRRYLSVDDIYNLEDNATVSFQRALELARNEIFARRGYQFTSKKLSGYYNQFEWYNDLPPSDVKEKDLNSYEKENIALIKSFETE